MSDNKHENYEILNLIGYGLAKFGMPFVGEFGLSTKSAFYEYIVHCGVAETIGTVKNRQDLFDPFFENNRKGWWQKGNAYIHRKKFIDSLFGDTDVKGFALIVQLYLKNNFAIEDLRPTEISPIIKSKFKQLQLTGKEAELYFIDNFREILEFEQAELEDARLFGDGYDFQLEIESEFILAEVKGVRSAYGAFRLTEREYSCAVEYESKYGIVVVSNLDDVPKMTAIFDPIKSIPLNKVITNKEQIAYHSRAATW